MGRKAHAIWEFDDSLKIKMPGVKDSSVEVDGFECGNCGFRLRTQSRMRILAHHTACQITCTQSRSHATNQRLPKRTLQGDARREDQQERAKDQKQSGRRGRTNRRQSWKHKGRPRRRNQGSGPSSFRMKMTTTQFMFFFVEVRANQIASIYGTSLVIYQLSYSFIN